MPRSLDLLVVCRTAALLGLGGLLASASLSAQPFVEINRAPERIEGSLEGGRNLIVTATVHGATADDVWMALVGTSERVELTRSGSFRYQVNLGRGEAARLLRRVGSGELAVFARSKLGTSQSVPIAFDVEGARQPVEEALDVEPLPDAEPESGTETDPVDAGSKRFFTRILALDARQSTSAFSARPSDAFWLVPETTVEIEARALFDEPLAGAAFVVGDRSWPLEEKSTRNARVKVTKEMVTFWRQSGFATLRVASGREAVLHAVPRVLPGDDAYRFLMGQRQVLELPGAGGQLEVALGDVTRGRVWARVLDLGGRPLARGQSLQVGDRIEFRHGGQGYELVLEDMVNFLVGDDRVWLSVRRAGD